MDHGHQYFEVAQAMQAQSHLAQLPDWRDEITLVPYSGTQMLDFGFSLDAIHNGPPALSNGSWGAPMPPRNGRWCR